MAHWRPGTVYGSVAGYKVGTFAAGEYDNGPVNGLSGPVTAVMLSKGMLEKTWTSSRR